jgi:hypothetical protein
MYKDEEKIEKNYKSIHYKTIVYIISILFAFLPYIILYGIIPTFNNEQCNGCYNVDKTTCKCNCFDGKIKGKFGR